ncbi:heavy-metal-associated domain-containing protein [Actinoplanes sp. TRM 88003]|uniref:Heavy-metal-associated domain-containing protein n=1 Tax=Paractinoplanes aksuensis TaxID=2939490 RepID=A0ABT1DEN1_9ACTN|nr:heavy metal-associated domain-containing protein [Actinoplanes aksuensis]MCO8269277.1 heavy-metal-associated domain-containing protein [Actinoplanes aksuensis]
MSTTAPPVTTLAVGGMTCAACSGRIERKLDRLPVIINSLRLCRCRWGR